MKLAGGGLGAGFGAGVNVDMGRFRVREWTESEMIVAPTRGVGFTNGGGQQKMGVVLPGKKERMR